MRKEKREETFLRNARRTKERSNVTNGSSNSCFAFLYKTHRYSDSSVNENDLRVLAQNKREKREGLTLAEADGSVSKSRSAGLTMIKDRRTRKI